MSIVFKDTRRSSDRFRRYSCEPNRARFKFAQRHVVGDAVSLMGLVFQVVTTAWLMLRH